MKTKSDIAFALDAAKATLVLAKVEVVRLTAALNAERAAAAEKRVADRAARVAAKAQRAEAKAARDAAKAQRAERAAARKQVAIQKLEAKLAKAKERAMKPVGAKKTKADRKPGKVTIVTAAAVAA